MSNTIYRIMNSQTGTMVDGEWAAFDDAFAYITLYLRANLTQSIYQIVPITKGV